MFFLILTREICRPNDVPRPLVITQSLTLYFCASHYSVLKSDPSRAILFWLSNCVEDTTKIIRMKSYCSVMPKCFVSFLSLRLIITVIISFDHRSFVHLVCLAESCCFFSSFLRSRFVFLYVNELVNVFCFTRRTKVRQ